MSSSFSFPSPVGGVALSGDLGPSIVFSILYASLLPIFLVRLANKESRAILGLNAVLTAIERYVIRQFVEPRLGIHLLTYMQVTFSLAYIAIAQDTVSLLRCLYVNSTKGPAPDHMDSAESPVGTTSSSQIPLSPSRGNRSSLDDDGQLEFDQPRKRALYRRWTDILRLAFLAATVPGIVGNIHYKGGMSNTSTANEVMITRYASSGASLALIILVAILVIRARRLPRASSAIFRLAFMYHKTTSLTSTAPGSGNSAMEKVTFYLFHMFSDWLACCVFLVPNIREIFNTGMWGDWRSTDPPLETTEWPRKRKEVNLGRSGVTYLESLEQSLRGGVTVVQVREKEKDTLEFLEIAQQSRALCSKYQVPLIINDRVDIAIAVKADGVHLGQTDMPVHVARALLPQNAIIGVSCNNIDHVRKAVEDRVDYIGIGPIWLTNTKKLTSPVVGVRGAFSSVKRPLRSPAGGITSDNLLRTLHGSMSLTGHSLDGIAVVSEIATSRNPYHTARALRDGYTIWSDIMERRENTYSVDSILKGVIGLMGVIRETNPLIHQITNVVVTNQSANATLALGASPIMATAPEDMEDLSRVSGSLLVNFGTVKDKEGMALAGRYANREKKPIIFDPVGVGATQFRREVADQLLNSWQASVIKGNAGELAALAGSEEVRARGVDSVGSGFADPAQFIRNLARRECLSFLLTNTTQCPFYIPGCVVALTGPTDFVSDGTTVIKLGNGHHLLGDITGSGCMVGTCIATFCAGASAQANVEDCAGKLVRGDMLLGAVGGILVLTIAAEVAALRSDVKGPGTFLPALIDELRNLKPETVLERAKVQVMKGN
ncbi:hypothetical protein ID866_2004 [Astraeus odoratus]|nr:hypothetical protein ID866_2004 [Astraeus odoratus]